MLKSGFYGYSDVYILVKGNIIIAGDAGPPARRTDVQLIAARRTDERNKEVVFKSFASFINCISEINNTEIDNTVDIDEVMPIYNLIEYTDNYSKTPGGLWQYYRDMPGEEEDAAIADSESFKSKVKITVKTPAAGDRKNVETAVPLKYLRKFWITLEMPLINCEINLILTWSPTCVITNSRSVRTFTRTDAKVSIDSQNSYLEYLVDSSFQGVNRLFVLSFEYSEDRKTYREYILPKVEIKDYSIMIDRRKFLDQPIKNDKRTYDDGLSVGLSTF